MNPIDDGRDDELGEIERAPLVAVGGRAEGTG